MSADFRLLVLANDLVDHNQKVTVAAASVAELEQELARQLELSVPITIYIRDEDFDDEFLAVADIEDVPATAKCQVRPPTFARTQVGAGVRREAEPAHSMVPTPTQVHAKKGFAALKAAVAVAAVLGTAESRFGAAPPGRKFVLMVVANSLVSTSQRVECTAKTLGELRNAVLEQLGMVGQSVVLTFPGANAAVAMEIDELEEVGDKEKIQIWPVASAAAPAPKPVADRLPAPKEFSLLLVKSSLFAGETRTSRRRLV
jgi:hypothetical protein